MEPYILLIGAFERENLGDLLFPKIFDKILYPYQTVKGSLMGRDMTSIGGDLVVSAKEYLAVMANNLPQAVIHCGGETITCLKKNGVSMDLPPEIFEHDKGLYQFCENEIAKKIVSSNNPLAYLYNHQDLSPNTKTKFPITFTSVGGSSLYKFKDDSKILSAIKSKLESSQFLSVRDSKTQAYLKKYLNIKTMLYPDVVHLLPRTNEVEINQAENNLSVKNIISKKPYLLFQASKTTIDDVGIDEITQNLLKIIENSNMSLVFQPAGIASGHGSYKKLQAIANSILSKNNKATVIIQEDRNIWNKVAVIKNCTCAIGTSLHVRIIASSFEKPCVSLQNEKVSSYVKSWKIDNQPYNIQFQDLPNAIKKALNTDSEKLKHISSYMADTVDKGLKELIACLNIKTSPIKDTPKIAVFPISFYRSLSHETDLLRSIVAQNIIRKRGLQREVEALRSSFSWRITEPIRWVGKKLRLAKQYLIPLKKN